MDVLKYTNLSDVVIQIDIDEYFPLKSSILSASINLFSIQVKISLFRTVKWSTPGIETNYYNQVEKTRFTNELHVDIF